jgi:hypothetical protein
MALQGNSENRFPLFGLQSRLPLHRQRPPAPENLQQTKGVVLLDLDLMILDLDRHPLAGATNTNEAALLQERGRVSSAKLRLWPKYRGIPSQGRCPSWPAANSPQDILG